MKQNTPQTKVRKPKRRSPMQITQVIMQEYPSTEVNPESLVTEFNHAIHLAKVYHQPSAMVAAIKAKAQLFGFLKDTHVVEGSVEHNHNVKISKVDLEERVKQISDARLGDVIE